MPQGRQRNEAASSRSDAFGLVQWLAEFGQFVHECLECQQRSPRLGHCAPIVTYGWRSPAHSVQALYPRLVHMPVRVVASMPPVETWARSAGCRPASEEQLHGRSAI